MEEKNKKGKGRTMKERCETECMTFLLHAVREGSAYFEPPPL